MDKETQVKLHASVVAITRMCDLFEEVLPDLQRADMNYLLDRFRADWDKYQRRPPEPQATEPPKE